MLTSISAGSIQLLFVLLSLWVGFKLVQRTRRDSHNTPLRGPPSPSFLFGLSRYIEGHDDPGAAYERWAAEYGPIYAVPSVFGSRRVILCDPKAIAHFYSKETVGYVQTALSKALIAKLIGRGLLWAEGESHKRQRKALTPAFSNAAIRKMTSVFYDSTYKAKAAWDTILESSPTGDAVIEVQKWMNCISLDSIGIAGFSHDFGALDGKQSTVADVFAAFGTEPSFASTLVFLFGAVFPIAARIPTARNVLFNQFKATMTDIAHRLLERTRVEQEGGADGVTEENSLLGLLIKAEGPGAELYMSEEEVLAQMNVLLIAGYETTSISLTWALIELARHPEVQTRLRAELLRFSGRDPVWDELVGGAPFLDGVVHEILRLHPPVSKSERMAAEDDIIPINGAPGGVVVTKGTTVTVPIQCINRSEELWGPDAKAFVPTRWLDGGAGVGVGARGVQGYRHLLTFVDGPRACLGRAFALAEFKAVLSVLVRHFVFELPEGLETPIGKHRSLLPRPKVVGLEGAEVPLRVKRVE